MLCLHAPVLPVVVWSRTIYSIWVQVTQTRYIPSTVRLYKLPFGFYHPQSLSRWFVQSLTEYRHPFVGHEANLTGWREPALSWKLALRIMEFTVRVRGIFVGHRFYHTWCPYLFQRKTPFRNVLYLFQTWSVVLQVLLVFMYMRFRDLFPRFVVNHKVITLLPQKNACTFGKQKKIRKPQLLHFLA